MVLVERNLTDYEKLQLTFLAMRIHSLCDSALNFRKTCVILFPVIDLLPPP
jgi:hypothetical protein